MQKLFAATFSQETHQNTLKTEPDTSALAQILNNLEEIDQAISQAAPHRPIAEINKIDLAILRLIVFESRHKKTPKKVLINEAVELAKSFGSDSSPKLVNAVAAKILLDSE